MLLNLELHAQDRLTINNNRAKPKDLLIKNNEESNFMGFKRVVFPFVPINCKIFLSY